MLAQKKLVIEKELSKELKDSIAIAETSGVKVPDFAIEIEQRVEAGEITSEQARKLYKEYFSA